MSNRLFQGIVHQMKDAIDRTIGVMDENCTVIACSELVRIGETQEFETFPIVSGNEAFVSGRFTYKPFGTPQHPEYTLFVDRGNFIKNVILDNILPGDIYLKSRELHFTNDVARVVLLIRITSHNDVSVYEVMQNLFPDKARDFVINISETDIAIVKEIKQDIETKHLEKLARSIVDTLSGEFYTHVVVGIGTVVENIKDLARSFKEAQMALEVGKVFDTEKAIVSYDNLGIARLIYQLPTTLCETFLREIFKRGSIESLDQETLFTIQRFFENNLNVSETSRKLFVHRNTLVYRLDKIKKITGLDLREFDHAIVFKIALMVKKYLQSNPIKY